MSGADPHNPASDVPSMDGGERADSPYAWFVLAVLVCVYILSSMDRTILSILAEDIKKSFAMTDGQLGFLHGTAFSVFYALFGYPMGRLIDRWRRTKMLAIAITIWSGMTILCGLSNSIMQMTAARIGVGIGEATASPAGFSLVSDWFTKRKRGTALGIFIGGLGIGSALALALGGIIVTRWELAFPTERPFGLEGWQATFVAVGLPGLLLAILVASLREPRRGLSDGIDRPGETNIWPRFFSDVASVIPPLTLVQAGRVGVGPLIFNLMGAAAAASLAFVAIRLSGDVMQWTILCIGYYAAFSSAQSMKHRDPPTFALTWKTPSFVLAMLGFGTTSVIQIVTSFWVAPLALRTFAIDKATVGTILGFTTLIGVIGVASGGRLADLALRYSPSGRIWVGMASAILPTPFIIIMCNTHNPWIFFPCYVPVAFLCAAWLAAGGATIQELVLPRMRGTSTTTYFFASTLLGSGLGPYLVGKVSTATGSLATAMLCSLVAVPIGVTSLWLCGRRIERDETTKWERAWAAGEPA
jgi:MFS family permease